MRRFFVATIGGVLALSLAVPSDAVRAQQAQPGVIERLPPKLPTEVDEAAPTPEREGPRLVLPPGAEEVVARIDSVTFSGASVVDEATLQAIAAPYLGREMTRGDIARLKLDVARLYFDLGYILVRVTTPTQDVSGGVLEVVIYESRIANIEIDNRDAIRPYLVDALTKRVQSGDVFHEQTVESMVNDIGDLGNVAASLNLSPGDEVGTTNMALTIERVRESVQVFTFDNYGAELLEEKTFSVSLAHSNLFGLGETLSVDGRLDAKDNLHSINAGLRTPVGWRNLMLEAHYINSEIEVDSADSDGDSEVFNVALSSALINQLRRRLVVGGGFETRAHETFIAKQSVNNDDIRRVFVNGSYLYLLQRAVLFGSVEVSRGVDVLGGSVEGDGDASRVSGDPGAWRVNPFFFASYRVTDDDTLSITASGQYASGTLLASDLFSLGGFGSLRGFEPAQATGEAGFQVAVDYAHEFEVGAPWLKLEAGPFLEYGAVYDRVRPSTVLDDHLADAGVSLKAELTDLPVGEITLRLDWAFPLGLYRDGSVGGNTILVRASYVF